MQAQHHTIIASSIKTHATRCRFDALQIQRAVAHWQVVARAVKKYRTHTKSVLIGRTNGPQVQVQVDIFEIRLISSKYGLPAMWASASATLVATVMNVPTMAWALIFWIRWIGLAALY